MSGGQEPEGESETDGEELPEGERDAEPNRLRWQPVAGVILALAGVAGGAWGVWVSQRPILVFQAGFARDGGNDGRLLNIGQGPALLGQADCSDAENWMCEAGTDPSVSKGVHNAVYPGEPMHLVVYQPTGRESNVCICTVEYFDGLGVGYKVEFEVPVQ